MNHFGIQVLECYEISYSSEIENTILNNKDDKALKKLGHSHDFYQYIYILDTLDSYIYMNSKQMLLKVRGMYLINPGVLHYLEVNSYLKMIELKFTISDENLANLSLLLPDYIQIENEEIYQILTRAIQEYKMNSLYSLLPLKIYELIICLLRTTELIKKTIAQPMNFEENPFKKLIEYINQNFKKDISISEMANFMHMEKNYFSKQFKKNFNNTPLNYLNSFRIFASLNLLEYSGYSIQQISEMVGFKNPMTYNNLFKKTYRLTPNEYRTKIKNAIKQKYDKTEIQKNKEI